MVDGKNLFPAQLMGGLTPARVREQAGRGPSGSVFFSFGSFFGLVGSLLVHFSFSFLVFCFCFYAFLFSYFEHISKFERISNLGQILNSSKF
jgi:hypothetical protein